MRNHIAGVVGTPLFAIAATVVVCIGVPALQVALMLGTTMSSVSSDLHYQCDSLVGPDPSDASASTVLPDPNPDKGSSWESQVPTLNPYAEVVGSADDAGLSDWQRGCMSALESAPYQLPPLQSVNAGYAVDCARSLALGQVNQSTAEGSGGAPDSNAAADNVEEIAELQRYVSYHASLASDTGQRGVPDSVCTDSLRGGRPPIQDPMPSDPGTCSRSSGGAIGTGSAVTVLPKSRAGQALCGQRVDIHAASPGDLVFWGYTEPAPTKSGIVVGPSQIVTTDPASGQFIVAPMPTGRDVRVKRVLSGGS
ncbi:hypothetical protein [Nocardia sp. CDC160]|uniref:hypothetical protein n=1 Tax=Nocardia sp. CDC160 TaxID=3112166 RepID=UPI002DBA844E|nr:hypothetical protein [Nocardia sp. CDC160]MEC3920664.1 hypothetical protein [Nocardia sp. CDC160]